MTIIEQNASRDELAASLPPGERFDHDTMAGFANGFTSRSHVEQVPL